jgi:hypothetical protein
MADQFVVLPCKDKKCEIATTLPLRSLQDVVQHRNPSSTDTDFVNFVCPHCGLGAVHRVSDLKPTRAESVDILVRLPLYCGFLQCANKGCELRVSVHTTAQSADENAEPTKALRNWKVGALECSDGHRAKEPIKLLAHHVFAPEGE